MSAPRSFASEAKENYQCDGITNPGVLSASRAISGDGDSAEGKSSKTPSSRSLPVVRQHGLSRRWGGSSLREAPLRICGSAKTVASVRIGSRACPARSVATAWATRSLRRSRTLNAVVSVERRRPRPIVLLRLRRHLPGTSRGGCGDFDQGAEPRHPGNTLGTPIALPVVY